METLQDAFDSNEVPSTAVGVDGDEVSLAILIPRGRSCARALDVDHERGLHPGPEAQ